MGRGRQDKSKGIDVVASEMGKLYVGISSNGAGYS